MKYLLYFVVLLMFNGCSKDETFVPQVNQLQQKLIANGQYHALSFLVNGKNTILPDSNNILGGPLTYLDINFHQSDSLEMHCELMKNGILDNSGPMNMHWVIDKYEERIRIIDDNLWTSKIFTGNHTIKLNDKNQLVITGIMNITGFPFELIMQ